MTQIARYGKATARPRPAAGSESVSAALTVVEDWRMIELEQLGGKGPG